MAPTDEERQEKAPLTGVMSLHDVIRHLLHYGPARNDAERAELLAAVNDDDPDAPEPEDAPLSDAEKIREYDRLQREKPPPPAPPAPAEPFPVPALLQSGTAQTAPVPPAEEPADDTTGGNH